MRHSDREGAAISHSTLRQVQTREGKSWRKKKEGKRGGQERRGEEWFSWEGRVFGWKATAYVLLEALTPCLATLESSLFPRFAQQTNACPLKPPTLTHTYTPHTTMHPHAVVMSLITIKMSMTASKCACVCQRGFVCVCVCVCETERESEREREREREREM